MDWPVVVVSSLSTLVVGVILGRVTVRQELAREARQTQRAAAEDLAASLLSLRAVARRAYDAPLSVPDVVEALEAFQGSWDRQAHRLPAGWGHVRQSVNSVLGESFGPVGWANIFASFAAEPVAEPDRLWIDRAERYIAYVTTCIQRWGDSAGRRSPTPPEQLDDWLRASEV